MVLGDNPGSSRTVLARSWQKLAFALVVLMVASPAWAAPKIALSSAAGGIAIGGSAPNYTGALGSVNGLGVGIVPAGETVISTGVAGGVLYMTPYTITATGLPQNTTWSVESIVTTQFTNTGNLAMENCPVGGSCAAASGYSVWSTSILAPTFVYGPGSLGNNTPVTAYLAVFVSNANGAGAITGPDSVTIGFGMVSNNTLIDTEFLTLTVTSQTAVQLQLQTAGGLTVQPGADYLMNFGFVNGLGAGVPSAGLSLVPAGGGVVYATPYQFQPAFSGLAQTTAHVSTYVSTDFAHPGTLTLQDSAAAGGPYNNISKVAGAPTVLNAAATSGSAQTRYLGLFVSSGDPPTAFPGAGTAADNAVLTFTLTVP